MSEPPKLLSDYEQVSNSDSDSDSDSESKLPTSLSASSHSISPNESRSNNSPLPSPKLVHDLVPLKAVLHSTSSNISHDSNNGDKSPVNVNKSRHPYNRHHYPARFSPDYRLPIVSHIPFQKPNPEIAPSVPLPDEPPTQTSQYARNSVFGLSFLPLPEERHAINSMSSSPSSLSSDAPTVYRAKSRLMPAPVPSTDEDDIESLASTSSTSTPQSLDHLKKTQIHHSVLLRYLPSAPIVGHKNVPVHSPKRRRSEHKHRKKHRHHSEEHQEDESNDQTQPLAPANSSCSQDKVHHNDKSKQFHRDAIENNHHIHNNPIQSQPKLSSPSKPMKSCAHQYGRPKQALHDLEEGLPASHSDGEVEEHYNNETRFPRERGVRQDIRRILARQRQEMPCNLQYDFRLVLVASMSVIVFILKPFFALYGMMWQSLQRLLLPHHRSIFDFVIGLSVLILYAIWLPILLAMVGLSMGLSLCGVIYLFRRCCVPVVEEFDIDKNIQHLHNKMKSMASPSTSPSLSQASISRGFLSTYTARYMEATEEQRQSWLPPEESLMSMYELLILPLLVAGEGVLALTIHL